MSGALPVDRQAEWLLESLETMPEAKRNARLKAAKQVAGHHNGTVLGEAIQLRWKSQKKKITDLATKGGCDYTTLRGYIRDGFGETPPILFGVCTILGIDRNALSEGRIEDIKSDDLEQEGVSLLKELFREGKGKEALDHLRFVRGRQS